MGRGTCLRLQLRQGRRAGMINCVNNVSNRYRYRVESNLGYTRQFESNLMSCYLISFVIFIVAIMTTTNNPKNDSLLTRDNLDNIFGLLDYRLRDNKSRPIEIVVCGGTSLIWSRLVTRTTKDVDVVALACSGKLQSPEPAAGGSYQGFQRSCGRSGTP